MSDGTWVGVEVCRLIDEDVLCQNLGREERKARERDV